MTFLEFIENDIRENGDLKVVSRGDMTDAELREHIKKVVAGEINAPTVRELWGEVSNDQQG